MSKPWTKLLENSLGNCVCVGVVKGEGVAPSSYTPMYNVYVLYVYMYIYILPRLRSLVHQTRKHGQSPVPLYDIDRIYTGLIKFQNFCGFENSPP